MDSPEVIRSKREVEIQMKLSHPNIVKLFDVVETDDRIYIIMEYSQGGELLSYINQKGKLSDAEARRLFLQLLSAIQYCHRHNIIHRDIKHKVSHSIQLPLPHPSPSSCFFAYKSFLSTEYFARFRPELEVD